MTETLDYWKFAAGLGLFLYSMIKVEDSLKELAGKRFKLFLRKYTTNRFLAIINGAFITAVLQSSSLVLLMVIAFSGAGILSISNSLGIILGANLGTTITGWMVSAWGFSAKIDSFIFPMLAFGSLGLIFFNRRAYISHLFGFVIAIGLLLMGLSFMKEGMSSLATSIDIHMLENYGLWMFFLFGFFVTTIIHSSSAMMTITLSALHANIITLTPAAFIIIGADLGTSITAILASMKGSAIKKRVGLAHFLFNVGTSVLALALALPILEFLRFQFGISDPLFILVAFHSGINLMGIVIFFPFLGLFEKFLNKFFVANNDKACLFIHKVSTEIPEASIEAIKNELHHFAKKVFLFNSRIVGFENNDKLISPTEGLVFFKTLLSESDTSKSYEQIKKMEGEILEYLLTLQKEKLDSAESSTLNGYIMALRNGVQSAKSTKDIQHNLKEFGQSVIEIVERLLREIHKNYLPVHHRINQIFNSVENKDQLQELEEVLLINMMSYKKMNEWIYSATRSTKDMESQIATFLNVNREIYSANHLLVESLKSIFLTSKNL